MKLDPSIVRALPIPPSASITAASHGGSGFTTTAKITASSSTSPNGSGDAPQLFFLKTSTTLDAEIMFRGEHASLNAIHAAVPSLCPASHAWGRMDSGGAFLVTGFLDMGGRSGFGTSSSSGKAKSGGTGSGMTLAKKLAKLHSTPAPVPAGGEYTRPQFGFEAPTCCGDTVQDNGFMESWAGFFAERRLMMILGKSERTNGKDASLRGMVEKTCKEVVPRLIGDAHLNGGKGVVPVVVHGDLWSGNKGVGRIDGGEEEEVVFDPSSCYAHSEYELGIMRMFGGFGAGFWREYHEVVPKTEPVGEYEDRVKLYECYHHLNHHAIFGGGYKSGAMAIMRDLNKKYGQKSEV